MRVILYPVKINKNTIKFDQNVDLSRPEERVAGPVYVQRSTLEGLGNPKLIAITIEAVDSL